MVTSDRIAVMNAGRIEQVDDPYTLYSRPKTRFVAGFIGRTNFLEGRRENGGVAFDGFGIDLGRFDADIGIHGADVLFSVRPQSLTVHAERPNGGAERCVVEGKVVERAYLGEHWDYLIAPANSGLKLRVSTTPVSVYGVGQPVWVEFDPKQMAVIT